MKPCAFFLALVACALVVGPGVARADGTSAASVAPPDEPTLWRERAESFAERFDCREAVPWFERSGTDWAQSPAHRAGLLYVWVGVRERCMAGGQSWTVDDDDLMDRLGAPFAVVQLDELLSQFPQAMRHLPRLWPFFADTKAERRIDVVDRHLAAFVARARTIDHCGADGGECERTVVHARLDVFRRFLLAEENAPALASFRPSLRAASRDAGLQVVFGDIIDRMAPTTVAKALPASSRLSGNRPIATFQYRGWRLRTW